MPKFFIKHITEYSYSKEVIDGSTLIRLHPINNDYQKVISHTISVTNNHFIETFVDFFNNRAGTFMITEPHNKLNINSDIEIETISKIFPEDSEDVSKQWDKLKSIKHNTEFIDFLKYKTFDGTPDIYELIKTKDFNVLSPYKIVLEFCEFIYKNFKYIQGVTHVDSKLDHAWQLKAGVCQDFTNILLQMVRMLGIPAKYVSGYIICPSDSNTRGDGATHAWIEAYIPFYGWLGIDPTNNAIANEYHVKLATGRDYNDCAPVKGVFKGNVESKMQVIVEVKTHKLNEPISFPENPASTTEINNSYKRNLEFVQQHQQQQ